MLVALLATHATSSTTALGKSFGVSHKGWHMRCRQEYTAFTRNCTADEAPCAMQHYWSGGTFAGYTETRVRYYVDGAQVAATDIPLGLAHGMSATRMEDNGPWSAGALFGKSGVGLHVGGESDGSGFFNTFHVPFNRHMNVTIALGCKEGAEYFCACVRNEMRATVLNRNGPRPRARPTPRLRLTATS